MRKFGLSLLSFLLVLGMGSVAMGQQASTDVTANVIKALEITQVSDVVFGDVEQGVTATIEPQGTGHVNAGATAAAGEFSVDGVNGNAVTVNYTNAVLSDGTNTMNFTTQLSESASGTQNTSTDLNSGQTITLDSDGYSLYVGGDLTVGAAQALGSYTTASGTGAQQVTVTITY